MGTIVDTFKLTINGKMLPLIFISLFVGTFAGGPYEGDALFRLTIENKAQASWLENLRDAGLELDFWGDAHPGKTCEIHVKKTAIEYFKSLLDEEEIQWVIVETNVQKLVDDEKAKNEEAQRKRSYGILGYYAQFDEIASWMDALAVEYGDILSIDNIGKSSEGRQLKVAKISTGGGRPAIFINAGFHSREWIAPASLIFVLNKLVKDYKSDRRVTALLNKYDWYIMPIANPDGYVHSHEQERFWRKTRSSNYGTHCAGADPNRNWDSNFGGTGTSKQPCADTFHGKYAFSEPETKAMMTYLTNIQRRSGLKMYTDIHAYSQLWFVPWAYTAYSRPRDYAELERVAKIGAAAIESVNGKPFKVGSPANILYAASGGAYDWAKATLGVKYSFALELRPAGGGWNGFIVDPSEIPDSGKELAAGILAAAEAML